MKKKTLLYGSLPPPYTGQSAMFAPVVSAFDPGEVVVINITRFKTPLPNTLWTILATLWTFLIHRFHTVYFTPSRSRMGFVKDLPLLFLGRWTGKRMIAHLHGANFRSFYETGGILKPLIRYGYRNIDTGIVLLGEMRDEFIHFPKVKVKVVPNCYDQSFDLNLPSGSAPIDSAQGAGTHLEHALFDFVPSGSPPTNAVSIDSAPYESAPEAITHPEPFQQSPVTRHDPLIQSDTTREQILYLSALMHSKGILEFLDAIPLVLERRPTTTFVVAGALWADASMGLKEITRQVGKRLDVLHERFPGQVRYLGLVTGKEKIDLLRDSAIFVMPGWHPSEALPVSMIEAMRTGTAIVATRHNFMPAIMGPQNGILVEPRSAGAIADAVLRLLEDPERLKMIQKHNVAHAIQQYSPARYCETIIHIIKEV